MGKSTTQNRRGLFGIIGLMLKWLVLSLTAFIISLSLLLSLENGKSTLTTLINKHLEGPNFHIKLHKFESFFPLIITVDSMALKEGKATWLDLESITLKVDLWQILLDKHVTASLSGKSISLEYLPENQSENQSAPAPQGPANPNPLSLPVGLSITLDLQKIHLGPALAGQAIDLSLKNVSVTYDRKLDVLQSTIPLTTDSFGSPLSMTLKLQGALNNFKGTVALITPKFHYSHMDFQDLDFNSTVTGLPFNPKGSIDLNFLYNNVKGALRIGAISTQDKLVSLRDISLKGLASNIQGNASYNLETSDIKSTLKGTITDLIPLSSLGGYPVAGDLTFKGDAAVLTKGTSADLTFQVHNLKNTDISIASLEGNLRARDILKVPTVLMDLKGAQLESSGLKLDTLNARCSLKKGVGNFTLQGQGEEASLNIAADLKITEDRQDIKCRQLNILLDKKSFGITKPFDILLTQDLIKVSPVALSIASFPLTLQGQKQGETLDFSLKGQLDLEKISDLLVSTDDIIKGLLQIDLSLKGTLQKPDLTGLLEVTKGGYENIVYGTKLHNLHLKATAKNDIITLKDIKAQDGLGGSMRLDGFYDMGKKYLDFKGELTNMHLANTNEIKVVAQQGNISVKGPLNNVFTKGALKVGETSYNIITAFAGSVPELNVVDPSQPPIPLEKAPKKSPEDFHMTLDMNVEIPPVVRIYGLGLESLWGGNLKVTQSLDDLLIIGKIALKRGVLDFLGQRIVLDTGVLTFDGQENNLPYLDIQASLKKSDLKALVNVSGQASKPKITLSSQPTLPQSEIVAYLLFGSKSSTLSPFDALKLAKIMAEFSGGSGDFTGLMKEQMNKKEVSVEGGDNAKEANEQSKDRLADKVHIHMDQGVKPTDSKVVVDIDVTDSITLSTEAGAAKSSESIGLNYKYDY